MVPQHGQSASLAVPQLGSRASSGRAWRLWAARHTNHSQGEAGPLGAQPSEPPPKPPIPLPLTAQVPPAQVGMVEARGRQGCQRVQAVWRGRRATRKGRRRRAAVGSRARGAASALARGGTVLVSERCVRSLAYSPGPKRWSHCVLLPLDELLRLREPQKWVLRRILGSRRV